MTPEAAASCDPDYGWINGPDGTNKCYMVLRVKCSISILYQDIDNTPAGE